MNPSAMKSLAVYLLLVGIPVAGLAAILRIGARLQAPMAVGGEWRIESPVTLPGDPPAGSLAIAQSGEHLAVTLGSRTLRGTLHDGAIAAARPSGGARGDCFAGTAIVLNAWVDAAADPMRMRGTLSANRAGCAPISFAAVRAAAQGERR